MSAGRKGALWHLVTDGQKYRCDKESGAMFHCRGFLAKLVLGISLPVGKPGPVGNGTLTKQSKTESEAVLELGSCCFKLLNLTVHS